MQENQAPYISTESPILSIECEKAFNGLTTQEKLYSYYFARASWEGAKMCYFQRSYESPALLYVLYSIFALESPSNMQTKLKASSGFTDDEISKLFVYCAAFFQNCGNYKSFGDTKFIPEISEDKFFKFISQSQAYANNKDRFDSVWQRIKLELYSYTHPYYLIEMSDNKGHTSYYSSNITKDEAEVVNKFLESVEISALNTRVLKHGDKDFEVLVCSYQKLPTTVHNYEEYKVTITYGDFAPIIKNLYKNLARVLPYVANENQRNMVVNYLDHFNNGSIQKHKDASKDWIKDKGPQVETYIGFIESYLDPLKVRAEFEGFVSIVNKQESLKLNKLVESAEEIIDSLPWPTEFEIESFTKPDFTSLEILSFASSGTPVGINIPNYDDIRQTEGFKNVDLGNVYGTPKRENIRFIQEDSVDRFVKYYKPSLFVIVALHELLGHGTGKLFQIDKEGKYNFDYEMTHPITNGSIETFYEHNQTYHGVFGEISSAYEECRADGVAIFLSCFQEALNILIPEFSKEQQSDIVYVAWLEIVYSAIKGLEHYDVEQKKWGQAHIKAAYVLMKVMLEAGEGLVSLQKAERDGSPYLYINLDKSKIQTVGKKAVGDFLSKLQIYKSIADVKGGTEFFEHYSVVDDEMIQFRNIAIQNKLPRKIELQHDVELINNDEDIKYIKFEQSYKGIIDSYIYHYRTESIEPIYDLWNQYADKFRMQQ